ncbi:7TM diverse intracellular signaling domain-containing protein [Pusillimonas sp. (ex Stolz et al. 2005)]|uniref:sensor histidine kinase n=1 Tax=Pusillimonas sp. (ex Stolz et al. 2005) TaxID=1979962 RepID=UPI0026109094|nr:7TM diverse intracellular signaling domain-containing protein [Pusillimonas sp. (ex Stolz et al. 2005)]
MTRVLAGWLAFCALYLGLGLATVPAWAAVPQDCSPQVLSISAARAGTPETSRPVGGWEPVQLPDIWVKRWPGYEGTAWYRIDWERACTPDAVPASSRPLALSLAGISMAGEVYLNDDLLWRDVSLGEPLSQSWNMPRRWLLPESALRDGVNTIWIRVVGMAAYTPGLGSYFLGPAEQAEAVHAKNLWRQRNVHLIALGLSGAMGCIYLVVWCLRRSELAFGWYALMSLCWVLYMATILATDAWPFSSIETHSRLNNIAFILYVAAFCLFTWRFGEQHLPRVQKALWLVTAAGVLVSVVASRPAMELVWAGFVLIFLSNCLQFQWHAWRTREPQHLLLALCWLVFLVVGVHDIVVLLNGWGSHEMWGAVTGPITVLFMALLLGGRLAASMHRIEHFNQELQVHAAQVRAELAEVLAREHDQELSHARLRERMAIVHDLHDGLGGSLVRSMAWVEQAKQPLSNERMLSLLKVLRDDLRQVIDYDSSATTVVPETPVQWLAPLRHRFTRLFDELEVAITWDVAEKWRTRPSALHCLGLARLVEEALSNVIKHGRARHVRVVCAQPKADILRIVVEDDGVGFDVQAVRDAGQGVGMRSMAARAERLGGSLDVESGPDGTVVCVTVQVKQDGHPVTGSVSESREAPG